MKACDEIRFTKMPVESTAWIGMRSAHTLRSVSDEERRQTERIGSENPGLILLQALKPIVHKTIHDRS